MAIILPYLDDDDDDFSFDKENNKKRKGGLSSFNISNCHIVAAMEIYSLYHYNFVYTRIKHIHIVIMDIVRFFFIFSISFNVLLSETS